MDAGADFLTGSAQQAVGAVRACAERPGVYWMATDMDQSSLAPDTVLAAQVYHWEKLVADMLELREQGIVGDKHLYLSFVDDTLEFRVSPRDWLTRCLLTSWRNTKRQNRKSLTELLSWNYPLVLSNGQEFDRNRP